MVNVNKYFNNDINNPIFLFHGSPKQLDVVEQRQAYDSMVIEKMKILQFL